MGEGGGHPDCFLVVLEGGVTVYAKPAATENADRMMRREVAAWHVARALGWSDLVSATVIREVPSPIAKRDVMASVQIIWAYSESGGPIDRFPEDDLWRAAVFDAVVLHSDRSASNFLGVPKNGADGEQRLKLIDHGYAFDLARDVHEGVATFLWPRRGQQIPDQYLRALECFGEDGPRVLDGLLDEEERRQLHQRIGRLLRGVLTIEDA